MAHSVCISGQLYLIELICSLGDAIPDIYMLQFNTDGIMFAVNPKYLEQVRSIVNEWCTRTGFGMEEDNIIQVRQRDVNNYVMRKKDGTIKAKGGAVSDWQGGTFKHNSMSIVCKAIVYYLLDEIPIEDTIGNCDDVFAFQMINKTGSTFNRVVHKVEGGERVVNKVNRIYASNNPNVGSVFKIKVVDGEDRYNKIPNCPEHAIIDNSCKISIDMINKQWYIDITKKKINQFKGIRKKKMTKEVLDDGLEVITEDDEKVVTEKKPIRKRRTKKEMKKEPVKEEPTLNTNVATKEALIEANSIDTVVLPPKSFAQKMFDLSVNISKEAMKFEIDGYNEHQNYQYVKASQYKSMFRKCLIMERLLFITNDLDVNLESIKNDKMMLTSYKGKFIIKDVDSDAELEYFITGHGTDNMDKGLSKAKTLAIKDFIKLNFLVSDSEDDPEESEKTENSKSTSKAPVSSYVKKNIVNNLMNNETVDADKKKELVDKILFIQSNGKPTFGAKTLESVDTMSNTKIMVSIVKIDNKIDELGLTFGETK